MKTIVSLSRRPFQVDLIEFSSVNMREARWTKGTSCMQPGLVLQSLTFNYNQVRAKKREKIKNYN